MWQNPFVIFDTFSVPKFPRDIKVYKGNVHLSRLKYYLKINFKIKYKKIPGNSLFLFDKNNMEVKLIRFFKPKIGFSRTGWIKCVKDNPPIPDKFTYPLYDVHKKRKMKRIINTNIVYN